MADGHKGLEVRILSIRRGFPPDFLRERGERAILHLPQIFLKNFMKNTKKVLDIHGLVYYYIEARVRGNLCVRTAMKQEIAP